VPYIECDRMRSLVGVLVRYLYYVAMHDIGARGPQLAAEPRPAAISAGCGPFFMPRPGRNFFVMAAARVFQR
jgi:hypothetical protein